MLAEAPWKRLSGCTGNRCVAADSVDSVCVVLAGPGRGLDWVVGCGTASTMSLFEAAVCCGGALVLGRFRGGESGSSSEERLPTF
jgi:hypothetical protein